MLFFWVYRDYSVNYILVADSIQWLHVISTFMQLLCPHISWIRVQLSHRYECERLSICVNADWQPIRAVSVPSTFKWMRAGKASRPRWPWAENKQGDKMNKWSVTSLSVHYVWLSRLNKYDHALVSMLANTLAEQSLEFRFCQGWSSVLSQMC